MTPFHYSHSGVETSVEGKLLRLHGVSVDTPREREVLAHVLTGRLNKQIASHLGIDERSVKRHRTSLMAKLNVESVAELTHLVHESGLQFSFNGRASDRP